MPRLQCGLSEVVSVERVKHSLRSESKPVGRWHFLNQFPWRTMENARVKDKWGTQWWQWTNQQMTTAGSTLRLDEWSHNERTGGYFKGEVRSLLWTLELERFVNAKIEVPKRRRKPVSIQWNSQKSMSFSVEEPIKVGGTTPTLQQMLRSVSPEILTLSSNLNLN